MGRQPGMTTMIPERTTRALAGLVALACLLSPAARAQAPATVAVDGPVSGGERGQPFGGFGSSGAPADYVEEEWFLTGTATAYTRGNEWRSDGRWDVTPAERAPYAIRMLVRRPGLEAFNGIVLVEWLNVSGRAEGAADYMQMAEEIVRGGYAWVGVGAQAVGIHAEGSGLKSWDPERYAALEHPGDRFSYDIFSHAARALRSKTGPRPLGDLQPRQVIATGRSQSAFRLVTYVNAIHPRDRLYDGYFVHSRGANAAGLRAESLAADDPPVPPGAWIREDMDVPVFDLVTGGDMVTLGAHHTRQPASDVYRRWELAGAAHAEEPRWVVGPGDDLPRGPGCATPINTAPHDAFVKAGLRRLTDWVRSGVAPPQSADIELADPDAADPIRRDEHGNALGGVRLPQVEAPTATLDGLQNAVAAGGPGGQNFCFLFGHTRPFDASTLRALYPDHATFVDRYVTAVDELERAGFLLTPEADTARAAARASNVGR